MIFGVLIAVIPTFARRRGLRLPGPSGLLTDGLAARAGQLSQRHLGGQGTKRRTATPRTSPAGSVPVRTVAPRSVRDNGFLLPNGPWFPPLDHGRTASWVSPGPRG